MTGSAVESRPMSNVSSPRQGRSQSISSDRPSIASHIFFTPPLNVSPEAAFIASTAASQIVTNDHDGHEGTWYDQNGVEPSGEAAQISTAALHLVNSFLDQLLLNFLQVARSTSLSALRPAVSDVLKPKLAKETISNADEELREYLGGSEEEEEEDADSQSLNARDWDVELAWKRARLRCMVYSSLGDLEEDDEDRYMTQENLEIGDHEKTSDIISPAVAIFLTSVLEYMGELTLTVAGQAASQRLRSKIEKELKLGTRSPAAVSERIVVEDIDMERVALDRTLGRLWRGWKKRMRAPPGELAAARSLSISHMRANGPAGGLHDRKSRASEDSNGSDEVVTLPEDAIAEDATAEVTTAEVTIAEDSHPMSIPLPMGDNDVAEIEVPGLAHHSDDEEEEEEKDNIDARRVKSFAGTASLMSDSLATESRHYVTLLGLHRRSTSLPTSRRSVFYATARPSSKSAEAERDFSESKELKAASEGKQSALKKNRASDESGSDEFDEIVYEKAEILTSSRVSVSSTSSRSASDSGRAIHLSRSSSVRSARLIDVPPRSPATTRPPSLESTERPRASTVSGTSLLSRSGGADELRKAKAIDTSSRTGAPSSTARSPAERMRPPFPNAATISESEEDTDQVNPIVKPAPASRARDQLSRLPHGLQTNVGSTPQSEQFHQRSFSLKAAKSATDAESPDITYRPAANPNRQIPVSAVDMTVPEESEETALHSIAPPRQIHTSDSSASSGTSRFRAVRTTSDDSSNRAESMARNFEELIQSNQTITYTLTPENMRDMDVKTPHDSPVVTKIIRKSEDLMRPSPTVSNASSSNPRVQPSSPRSPPEHKPLLSGPIPHAPAGATVVSGRMGGPQAREARTPGESLANFAEFIKSTGPPGDKGPAALRNVRAPVSPTTSVSEPKQSISSTASRGNNRNRYQPREAAASSRNDNSDLIDFIRQGPPIPGSQNHIPRHVAPFRNTTDLDMMSGAVGGRAVDAYLPDMRHSRASTSVTDNSMPSIQSSINSSSALLKNNGMSKANRLFGEEDDDDDMGTPMPVRKTRRIRDPYAIDFSDEEEDDFDVAPRPPPKREESLAEFLLNYDPPPEPPSSPLKMPKKKTSSPSLIGRFTRSGSKEVNTFNEVRAPSSRASARGFGNEARSLNGRAKHTPIQMPPGYDAYGPTTTTTNPPPVSMMNRAPIKRLETREPVSYGQTADLARFLRDSEPPPEIVPAQASVSQDEPSGFARMFGRRRKASVV